MVSARFNLERLKQTNFTLGYAQNLEAALPNANERMRELMEHSKRSYQQRNLEHYRVRGTTDEQRASDNAAA